MAEADFIPVEINLSTFCASVSWCDSVKQNNLIVERV